MGEKEEGHTGEPPALPGEVWRGMVGGVQYAVAPWLACPFMTWKWTGPGDGDTWIQTNDDGEIATIEALGAWAMAERARAEKAERERDVANFDASAAARESHQLRARLADVERELADFRAVARGRT